MGSLGLDSQVGPTAASMLDLGRLQPVNVSGIHIFCPRPGGRLLRPGLRAGTQKLPKFPSK